MTAATSPAPSAQAKAPRPWRPRRATPRDLAALVALEAEFPTDRISRRAYRSLLQSPAAEVWVIPRPAARGSLAGSLVLLHRPGTRVARVYSVVATPALRRQGLATALYRRAAARAKRRGCATLRLEVRQDNEPGQAIVLHLGYRPTGLRPAYYEDGTAAVRFALTL